MLVSLCFGQDDYSLWDKYFEETKDSTDEVFVIDDSTKWNIMMEDEKEWVIDFSKDTIKVDNEIIWLDGTFDIWVDSQPSSVIFASECGKEFCFNFGDSLKCSGDMLPDEAAKMFIKHLGIIYSEIIITLKDSVQILKQKLIKCKKQ